MNIEWVVGRLERNTVKHTIGNKLMVECEGERVNEKKTKIPAVKAGIKYRMKHTEYN